MPATWRSSTWEISPTQVIGPSCHARGVDLIPSADAVFIILTFLFLSLSLTLSRSLHEYHIHQYFDFSKSHHQAIWARSVTSFIIETSGKMLLLPTPWERGTHSAQLLSWCPTEWPWMCCSNGAYCSLLQLFCFLFLLQCIIEKLGEQQILDLHGHRWAAISPIHLGFPHPPSPTSAAATGMYSSGCC